MSSFERWNFVDNIRLDALLLPRTPTSKQSFPWHPRPNRWPQTSALPHRSWNLYGSPLSLTLESIHRALALPDYLSCGLDGARGRAASPALDLKWRRCAKGRTQFYKQLGIFLEQMGQLISWWFRKRGQRRFSNIPEYGYKMGFARQVWMFSPIMTDGSRSRDDSLSRVGVHQCGAVAHSAVKIPEDGSQFAELNIYRPAFCCSSKGDKHLQVPGKVGTFHRSQWMVFNHKDDNRRRDWKPSDSGHHTNPTSTICVILRLPVTPGLSSMPLPGPSYSRYDGEFTKLLEQYD